MTELQYFNCLMNNEWGEVLIQLDFPLTHLGGNLDYMKKPTVILSVIIADDLNKRELSVNSHLLENHDILGFFSLPDLMP